MPAWIIQIVRVMPPSMAIVVPVMSRLTLREAARV
jgi:hypothetical protein